jgi:hypothetical protein
VAILVASVFTVVGISSLPVQRAIAQAVTIETSADDHGGVFFGGMLQVVIEDENTDDDASDTIDVDITVEEDGGSSGSSTETIDDTTDGSQRFEFFLVHEDADDIAPDDPLNDATTEVFTWGPTGDIVVAGFDEYDSGSVEIEYGDETVTIDYDESSGELTVDRETPYGTTSIIHLMITDPDGNLDPTVSEDLSVAVADVAALLDITGGSVPDAITFEETGDNTAIFEAEITIAAADTATDPELVFTNEVVTVELTDMVDYNDAGFDDAENDSTDTDELTITIEDSDGEVGDVGDLTFGSELKVTVNDDDQNRDSEDDDTISEGLIVTVDGAVGADEEFVDLTETGDNTGVFEIDASNGELRITFLDDAGVPVANNTILELRAEDIEEDIEISYLDPLNDDSEPEEVATFTVAMALTPGALSAPAEVGVTDEFTVTLNDADLNDNPRVRDSYTWSLTGASPFTLQRGGDDLSEIYTLEIDVDGEPVDFGAEDVSTTMSETGINTGIFEFDIDMDDVSDFGDGGDPLEVSDGDDVDLTINDFMADVADPDEDDVSITIGKPAAELDFSRTVVPLPPEAGSATATDVGETIALTMILVDPILNNQTNVEQTYDFAIGDDANEWLIEVEGADGLEDCALVDGDTLADCDLGGVTLDDVLDVGTLDETGENTGIFEVDLEFVAAGTESGDWQDAEFTFTYTNDEGDDESAGFTFRGNDGVVTVDQPSAKTGTTITITVEDQDLNLDDAEIDQFDSNDAGGLLLLETEDDEIAGVDDDTFEETGEDTGVFTATFVVGEDIPLVDVAAGDQASNILITYNDEVDSAGGGGDEIEVNVPVASSTGSIQVTPELVGPATTLTVLIVDSDLDEDANSVDEWTDEELDGSVEFSSSRNEVGEAGPDIEETGQATGVFMFTLELITDEEACADDDLGAAEFEASGGDTDSEIGACPGDLIAIKYEDENTAGSGGSTVSEVVEVMSWDPEFVSDKDSYGTNDRVTITVSDPDGNRDPDIADTLSEIRVTSDSDRVGEEFSAIETGRDTGVFRLNFGTTSGTAGGSISVKTGDDLTVRYTDEFPADFVDQEEDKDFFFTVPVGAGGTTSDTTTPSAPIVTDVSGQELDEIATGTQVVLSTTIVNNQADAQPFAAIVEVRDGDGITRYLQWQIGTLPASGRANVGLSWTPDAPGDYTVRTFVLDKISGTPAILSPIVESEITVS